MMLGDHIPMKVIDAVNAAIDNPSKQDKELTDYFGSDDDYFGITTKAHHRKYGHDMAGLMRAVMVSPEYGAEIWQCHIELDLRSNDLRDSYGTFTRDMTELNFNEYMKYMYYVHKKGNEKVPPMFPAMRGFYNPIQKEKNFKKTNSFYKFKRQNEKNRKKDDDNFNQILKMIDG